MKPREHILIAVAVVRDAGSLPDANPPSYLFLFPVWKYISIVTVICFYEAGGGGYNILLHTHTHTHVCVCVCIAS